MAKKTIVQCDRCGKPINEGEVCFSGNFPAKDISRPPFKIGGMEEKQDVEITTAPKDMCNKCIVDFLIWWDQGRIAT